VTVSAKRILVVDDHPDSAASLAELLRLQGHATAIVEDARTAIAAALDFRPNVAILDLNMPFVSGFQLAALLLAEVTLGAIWLIALTAYDDPQTRARTKQAGFHAHLVKPVKLPDLAAVLARLN